VKFLILNTDYPAFLHSFYAQHPGLENRPYQEQMSTRVETLFGVADFYSSNLKKLGYEAIDICANNECMQRAWAGERGLSVGKEAAIHKGAKTALEVVRRLGAKTPMRRLGGRLQSAGRSLGGENTWFYDVLAAQIRYYKPDVLINQAVDGISSRFLSEMKPLVRLIVGQHAALLPATEQFRRYGLIISSLPSFVDYFRGLGVPSELSRLAFEPRVLSSLASKDRGVSVSFVGTLSAPHQSRVHLLEHLCANVDIRIWGRGIGELAIDSPIRACHFGEAWGAEMYRILHASKVSLNHHIGIAGSFANNMRLYEATGVGTLLVTDWKDNLVDIFEPGKEVLAYHSPEECVELIRYCLEHDEEREAIAMSGQKRTLSEHTYFHRMQELVQIVGKYL